MTPYRTYWLWPPPVLSCFINPINYVISIINHSYWSYVHELSYRLGAPQDIGTQAPRMMKNGALPGGNHPQLQPPQQDVASSVPPDCCFLHVDWFQNVFQVYFWNRPFDHWRVKNIKNHVVKRVVFFPISAWMRPIEVPATNDGGFTDLSRNPIPQGHLVVPLCVAVRFTYMTG